MTYVGHSLMERFILQYSEIFSYLWFTEQYLRYLSISNLLPNICYILTRLQDTYPQTSCPDRSWLVDDAVWCIIPDHNENSFKILLNKSIFFRTCLSEFPMISHFRHRQRDHWYASSLLKLGMKRRGSIRAGS